jgi:hypothetical protein
VILSFAEAGTAERPGEDPMSGTEVPESLRVLRRPLPSPTVVVLAAPSGLRRPVAFAVTVIAAAVAPTAVTVPEAVLWFAPVLLVKLLLGHMLPEEASS